MGKTHLALSIGICGIHAGYTVLYRSVFDLVEDIDEFGMRNLPANASEDLLEIFHRRYHKGATIIATKRPLEDWGKVLGDHPATSAILDRFMDNSHLIKITGRSYRLKKIKKMKLTKNKKFDNIPSAL